MDDPKVPDAAMARLAGLLGGGAAAGLGSLGKYRLLRRIADGASGRVYEAEDPQLGRRVAIKVLHEGTSEAHVRRFQREASIAAGLRHPNLVTIHEVSIAPRPDGSPAHFLVMDFHERTLEEAARTGLEDRKVRVGILAQVARAVHFAHGRGIIHRDLKPANILMDREGRPIVTDFGLARGDSQATKLTRSGAPVGTPCYMSPEQAAGRTREIGPASDVFALGVILYELVTGRLPFPGANVTEIYGAILNAEPAAPRASRPDLDRDLEMVILKALEKEIDRRYASAAELAEDLEAWLEGRPVRARSSTVAHRLVRQVRRRPALFGLSVLALAGAAAAGIAVVSLAGRNQEKDRLLEQAARSDQVEGAYFDLHFAALAPLQKLEDRWHQERQIVLGDSDAKPPDGDPEPAIAAVDRAADEAASRHPAARLPRAWKELARFYGGRSDGRALEEVAKDAGEDPFPRVLLARRHLAAYTRMAYVEAVLGSGKKGGNLGRFAETTEMKRERGLARQVLDQTVGLPSWSRLKRGAEYLAYAEAVRKLGDGEFASAADVLAGFKDHPVLRSEAEVLRGVALVLSGDLRGAAAAWEAVYRARPWPNVGLLAAMAWLDSGEHERVAGVVALLEAYYPEWSLATLLGAQALERRGDLAAALPRFERVVRISGDCSEAWKAYGHALAEAGKPEEARRALDRAVELDPRDASIRLLRGDVLGTLKQFKAAIADLDVAVSIEPENPRAWFERARVRDDQADESDDPSALRRLVLADYDKAIGLKADYAVAWSNRGNAYLQIAGDRAERGLDPVHDYESALADLAKALELDGTLAETRMLKGHAQRGIGDWTESRGGDPTAAYEAAAAEYGAMLALRPEHENTLYSRALAYGVLGSARARRGLEAKDAYERSRADFATLVRLKGDSIEYALKDAQLLECLGRTAEAAARYDDALRFEPENEYAKARRAVLRRGEK